MIHYSLSTGVPFAAYSMGTFLGCLPAVTAYVSAGQLGAEIAVNGADANPLLLALGPVMDWWSRTKWSGCTCEGRWLL